MDKIKPSLFGINKSNRDFSQPESWGKNQFNSSFPASLACFMHSKSLKANYICLNDKLETVHRRISFDDLFRIDPLSENAFFSFETPYTSYQQLLIGTLPRIDLVIHDTLKSQCVAGIEIKLTALPDNSTCDLNENRYGSEIIIRQDTIVYLACSIALNYISNKRLMLDIFGDKYKHISDWAEPHNVIDMIPKMANDIKEIYFQNIHYQIPIVMQPIWKTKGKSPELSENCLDIFVWSNFAFSYLFLDVAKNPIGNVTRHLRTIVWLFKMLYDFCYNGQFDHSRIIDTLSYNIKNDKAFSVSGLVTYPYMKCLTLTNPRIPKTEIKNIILGGGQNLLSPERRFDSIIYNSPELFK